VADDLPPDLAALVERIVAPQPSTGDVPGGVSGELAALLSWWLSVSDGAPLVADHVTAPAVPPADAQTGITNGAQAADRAIDAGATILVPRVSVRDDVTARTIIALLTRKEASAVLGQPPGMGDRDWMVQCASIRDRAAAAADHRGAPVELLGALDGRGVAHVVGVLLAAAARRTPCLVDGTDELAAALVADRLCYRAKGWWRAGSDSPDPGRATAIDRVDLPAGLPLQLTDDEGRGAQATLALLASLAD
jgi:nicotinate-nucleotide--dimethylbenzimidazole phosphoribosyltransferase